MPLAPRFVLFASRPVKSSVQSWYCCARAHTAHQMHHDGRFGPMGLRTRLLSPQGTAAHARARRPRTSACPSTEGRTTTRRAPGAARWPARAGDAPADVVEDDGDLFTFRDIRPASRLHLLVIPRTFVRDASQLSGAADAELVRRMRRKATALVRAEVGAAYNADELALGFHWPPWYSVPWLHLHAIYPKREITRWYKYTPFSFYSPERVIERIERIEAGR